MKGSHFLGKWLLGDGWGFDRSIFQFSFVNIYRSGGCEYFIQVDIIKIEVVCKLRNRIIIRVTEIDCEKEKGHGPAPSLASVLSMGNRNPHVEYGYSCSHPCIMSDIFIFHKAFSHSL